MRVARGPGPEKFTPPGATAAPIGNATPALARSLVFTTDRALLRAHQAELVRVRQMRVLRHCTDLVEQRARPRRSKLEAIAADGRGLRRQRLELLEQHRLAFH